MAFEKMEIVILTFSQNKNDFATWEVYKADEIYSSYPPFAIIKLPNNWGSELSGVEKLEKINSVEIRHKMSDDMIEFTFINNEKFKTKEIRKKLLNFCRKRIKLP